MSDRATNEERMRKLERLEKVIACPSCKTTHWGCDCQLAAMDTLKAENAGLRADIEFAGEHYSQRVRSGVARVRELEGEFLAVRVEADRIDRVRVGLMEKMKRLWAKLGHEKAGRDAALKNMDNALMLFSSRRDGNVDLFVFDIGFRLIAERDLESDFPYTMQWAERIRSEQAKMKEVHAMQEKRC